jgi:hypothetical protein
MAQAGTAISRRNFRRPQAYNLITVQRYSFIIETRVYRAGAFERAKLHAFKRTYGNAGGPAD